MMSPKHKICYSFGLLWNEENASYNKTEHSKTSYNDKCTTFLTCITSHQDFKSNKNVKINYSFDLMNIEGVGIE